MTPIRLGPFALIRIVGRGAMGEVWIGHHEAKGVPVAVKVLTRHGAGSPLFRRAIRREVRAIAALEHPSIVTVFDTGEVGEAAAESSEGQLVASSPYLVIELASGGSLDDVALPLDWPYVRTILLEILDGLAHAHARGVVHRDLKPGNVLISTVGDVRPGIKLTDFGLAHSLTGKVETSAGQVVGTPAYMAPEQLLGQWREYGAWTDLYALGCMTFELVTGHLPFDADNIMALAQHHLQSQVPAIGPHVPVPDGLAGWVRRLMAKSPAGRFQTAADAAWALLGLGDSSLSVPKPEDLRASLVSLDRLSVGQTSTLDAETDTWVADTLGESSLSGSGGGMRRIAADSRLPTLVFMNAPPRLSESTGHRGVGGGYELPPLPATWRRVHAAQSPIQIEGVGLRLFGLRSVPLVARHSERDMLWSLLGQTVISGSTFLAVIRGKTGVGKSALAQWMAERTAEVGAATVLSVTHSPNRPSGIAKMLLDHLHADGLDAEELAGLLGRRGQEHGAESRRMQQLAAAVEALIPGSFDQDNEVGFAIRTPEDRYRAWSVMLGILARTRPVLLVLNDVQWAPDTLRFVEYLLRLQSRDPLPALILATARDETLEERSVESRLLSNLQQRADVETVSLSPLGPEDHRVLVERIVQLDPALVDQLVERTSGNPLFATQIIGDWIQREYLVVGDHGFRLREGADPALPDQLHSLWRSRLERLLAGLGKDDGTRALEALQTSALLGMEIADAEWKETARRLKWTNPTSALKLLAESDLVSVGDNGFSFSHQMFRESLERWVEHSGKTEAVHERCLEVIDAVHPAGRDVAERRAFHLRRAGRLVEAFAPLLDAARHRALHTEYDASFRLIEEAESLLSETGAPASDRRWLVAKLERVQALFRALRLVEALDVLEAISRDQVGGADAELLARADLLRGQISLKMGLSDEAIGHFVAARQRYEELGDRVGLAFALLGEGEALQKKRRTPEGMAILVQAEDLFSDLGHHAGLSQTFRMLAYCANDNGDFHEMTRYVLESRAAAERSGDRYQVAFAEFDLGVAALNRGERTVAREAFLHSLTRFVEIGSSDAAFPRSYLGAMAVTVRNLEEAERWLTEAVDELEGSGRSVYAGAAHVGMMAVSAMRGRWEAFDTHAAVAFERLATGSVLYSVIAHTAEHAAAVARDAGELARAARALEVARIQWRLMNRDEDAARVGLLLDASS